MSDRARSRARLVFEGVIFGLVTLGLQRLLFPAESIETAIIVAVLSPPLAYVGLRIGRLMRSLNTDA